MTFCCESQTDLAHESSEVTMTDLSSLSVKQLKMVISQAGLSFADCSEKAELVRRAGEAQALLSSQEESDDEDDGGASHSLLVEAGLVACLRYIHTICSVLVF